MISSHIFQFQHPIIVRKASKNKYKFRQIAVIFQVGFVSFSVCSPDFSPHHVGADDSAGPICTPVLFFLLIEKEKNRRGVRRSQLHSVSAGAAKTPYPQPSSSFPNCDRFTGSQFGHLEFYNAARYLDDGGHFSASEYVRNFFFYFTRFFPIRQRQESCCRHSRPAAAFRHVRPALKPCRTDSPARAARQSLSAPRPPSFRADRASG